MLLSILHTIQINVYFFKYYLLVLLCYIITVIAVNVKTGITIEILVKLAENVVKSTRFLVYLTMKN